MHQGRTTQQVGQRLRFRLQQTVRKQVVAGTDQACQAIGLSLEAVEPPKENKDVTELLTKLADTVTTAAGLSEKFITFSDGGSPTKERVNLRDKLRDTVIRALVDSDIRLRFDIPENLWNIDCDCKQMIRVFNLF